MKATNLKTGDTIIAKYVPSAPTSQAAGHRAGDTVRTGRFVNIRQQRVQRVTVEGDKVTLVLAGASLTPNVREYPANTLFEVIRNGEVL